MPCHIDIAGVSRIVSDYYYCIFLPKSKCCLLFTLTKFCVVISRMDAMEGGSCGIHAFVCPFRLVHPYMCTTYQ